MWLREEIMRRFRYVVKSWQPISVMFNVGLHVALGLSGSAEAVVRWDWKTKHLFISFFPSRGLTFLQKIIRIAGSCSSNSTLLQDRRWAFWNIVYMYVYGAHIIHRSIGLHDEWGVTSYAGDLRLMTVTMHISWLSANNFTGHRVGL